MQDLIYRELHKGGSFACASQSNVSDLGQGGLPKRDRDSMDTDFAYTFCASNLGRYTVLTGQRLPEIILNNTDHRLYSLCLLGHVA